MPRIDGNLLRTVFYIYPNESAWARNDEEDAASGFFFLIPSSVDETKGYVYAVTNKHVIANPSFSEPTLGVDTRSGTKEMLKTDKLDWVFHEDGDDLAVCLVSFRGRVHDLSGFLQTHIATPEFIQQHNVGVGDEVIMLGRHKSIPGRIKNLPTVRFGSIAKMPLEPIKNPFSGLDCESYIVEMRSVSGFSGSPVIVFIPPFSNRWKMKVDGKRADIISPNSYQRLLGIDWGHLKTKEIVLDQSGNKTTEKHYLSLDSAMTGVVPASKLWELLSCEKLAKERYDSDQEILAENQNSLT